MASSVTVTLTNPGCKYGTCYDDVGVRAAAGERNVVRLSQTSRAGGWALVVEDSGAELSAGRGCHSVDAHTAQCDMTEFDSLYTSVKLGDRADRFDSSAFAWHVRAYGGAGDDTLVGGPEADGLAGGPGTNVLDGRGGSDYALFGGSVRNLRVDLTASGPQGGDGSRDILQSIENVRAPRADDAVLVGDAGPNELAAGARGLVNGQGDDDTLSAGEGGRLFAGPGDDTLTGGLDERTDARRPLRLIDCGTGVDSVAGVILGDLVNATCDTVRVGWFGYPFSRLVATPRRGQAFATLSYACDIPKTDCPLELVARIGDNDGTLVARRRDEFPYSPITWHDIALTLNATGRAELANRRRMRIVVFYREGPFKEKPRWYPRRGFSMVLKSEGASP
jgi:hypothetical protein